MNRQFLASLLYIIISPLIIFYIILIKKKKTKIIWGPIPIINIKNHSKCLNELGYDSITLVSGVYHINSRNDFDLTYNDLLKFELLRNNNKLKIFFGQLFAFLYTIRNASVYNCSYYGGYLGNTFLWKIEFFVYKFYGIRTIISAFGGDVYQYSKIVDFSLKHGLILSYPQMAKQEEKINKKVKFFTKNACLIINGNQFEGLGRYDLLPQSNLIVSDKIISTSFWPTRNKKIKIAHCPNHRGFKGTEFVIEAIERLKNSGYSIDLILFENVPNNILLKRIKNEVDILVEQLICPTYGMNAVEGMACGKPVLTNLSNVNYSQVFRRYSFLNECPILSTNPENIYDNLKLLLDNKDLREELGQLGIKYVKKYHSIEAGKYFFSKIYNQLLNNEDEDLINMYHPLKSEYVKNNYIKTPLINNNYLG